MKRPRLWSVIVVALFIPPIALFSGCGSSSSDGVGTGIASLVLSDATIDGVQAVYVTIEEVSVHKEGGGGWEVIAEPNQTYNLIELVNGVRESLGIAVLETGHYTQLRMKVREEPDDGINILGISHSFYGWGNYVIDDSNVCHELKLPSGYQSGFKVLCGFVINLDQTTELILDFDASRSIVEAGTSDNLLLKPTIKVLETEECAKIDGTVTDGVSGLPGVLVSVQSFDPAPLPPSDPIKDRVVVQASTMTDADGSYAIFIAPGTYNIVAYKDGYTPACAEIEVLPNSWNTGDFTLATASLTHTITSAITIEGGNEEQHATISFRQSTQCNSQETEIELKSVNILNAGEYVETLPARNYIVVASTYDETTQLAEVDITDEDIRQDFVFPPGI
jgi:hypothetical protein